MSANLAIRKFYFFLNIYIRSLLVHASVSMFCNNLKILSKTSYILYFKISVLLCNFPYFSIDIFIYIYLQIV